MDNKKILVIGHGLEFSAGASSLIKQVEEKGMEVIMVNDLDNFGEPNPKYFDTEAFVDHFTKTKMEVPELYSQREFTCKGKHQYRENNGQWICQCGRNMNS